MKFGCSFELRAGMLRMIPHRPSSLIGIPYDRPVIGYGGKTVNTLRLWSATARARFDFQTFSGGDFVAAIAEALNAESLTRVLYPDDHTPQGRELRLMQEYFLVACSLGDIVRRFRESNSDWRTLPDKAAIQLNDTHPALAVAGADADLARRGASRMGRGVGHHPADARLHQPHPVAGGIGALAGRVDGAAHSAPARDHLRNQPPAARRHSRALPRRRRARGAHQPGRGRAERKHIRMANLAIVGSHSTNGVAAIHSELLRKTTVRDLAEVFPDRFNNKTNGVTPRRWLMLANPALADTISAMIGDGWVTDLAQLQKLRPLAGDGAVRAEFRKAKRAAKARFADWAKTRLGCRRRPRHDLRLSDQAHSRIQAAVAQRPKDRRPLPAAAREPRR